MLRLGREIVVGHNMVVRLMRKTGRFGLPLKRRLRRTIDQAPSVDLLERNFARSEPDQLWVTDITEHRTREGKVYCCLGLDTFSRRVFGWSIDSTPTAALATNALSIAIENRRSDNGVVVHADHGIQYTSWAFTHRLHTSGLLPSMGSVGDCYENARVEAFLGRMQTEILNRRRSNTRVELANAMFDYIESFHNRQRRHSPVGMLTPIEYESRHSA